MKVSFNLSVEFGSIKLPGIMGGSAEGAKFSIGGSGEYTLDEIKGLTEMMKQSINELVESLGGAVAAGVGKASDEEPEAKDDAPADDETYSEYLLRKGLC